MLRVPCGDGDDDGRHCLWAICHVQENLTLVATVQENVGAGSTAMSTPGVLYTHWLN